MGQLWEFLEEEEITKDIQTFKQRPNGGAFSPDVDLVNTTPTGFESISLTGMTVTEKNAQKAKCLAKGTTFGFAMVSGETITGHVVGYRAKRIRGTVLFEVSLRLKRTDLGF